MAGGDGVSEKVGLQGGYNEKWNSKERGRFGQRFDKYHISGADKRELVEEIPNRGLPSDVDIRHWDFAPPKEYFDELARISVNQIIWGGNYFDLPPTRCFLIWEKQIPENFTMAMCEYAWTSFNDNAKIFSHRPQGNKKEVRFHPTQKPVALYEWIIGKYAKAGDKIIDTHAGSGSCCVAAHRTRHEWLGFEIDKYYFKKAEERIIQEQSQMSIFDFM